jgi:glycosyltransferase involved in cell wall biosynthesis
MSDSLRDGSVARASAAVFLVDHERGSYTRAAELYAAAFDAAGLGVEMRSYSALDSNDLAGRWVLHHTIGPLFQYVPGARNTAVVFHEWSRYPSGWRAALDQFESVWAPSRHVEELLLASGLKAPLHYVPPPLAHAGTARRSSWQASRPFRFLAVGEPHFRKGFHLLLEGYQRAFPHVGEAQLTLKVSPACTWETPRDDITLVRERLSPDRLSALYAEQDALVSVSLGEGLGLPVAEAVDALMPVTTNLWGGHRDTIGPDGAWVIPHDEMPQLFCSAPSYFAEGQRCAYSSPERIASALLAIASATPEERERRARVAYGHLCREHDVSAAADRVRQSAL